jgi:hypothetical protein
VASKFATLLNRRVQLRPKSLIWAATDSNWNLAEAATSSFAASWELKIRICLTCREHYIQFFVRKMIDKVIVPALVREYLESLKASADTPPNNAATPPRASAGLPKKKPRDPDALTSSRLIGRTSLWPV